MSMQDIAAALQRVEAALERRPDMGLHDDAPATAMRNATPLALQIEVD
jgi:hypothetical protein